MILYFIYLTSLVGTLIIYIHERQTLKEYLPINLLTIVKDSTVGLYPLLQKGKTQIHSTMLVLVLIQILAHLRIPSSKGDLFAMIFEEIVYFMCLVFCLYLLQPLLNSLSDSLSEEHWSKALLKGVMPWANRAYYWSEFRADQLMSGVLVAHLLELVLSLL